jgi:hypothetical protein
MGVALCAAVARSVEKMQKLTIADLSESNLKTVEGNFRSDVEKSLTDGSWLKHLPGREILKRFVSDEKLLISYEVLRNLTISKMAEIGFKPPGMKAIIDHIAAD